jgi:hypothetical protein
MTDLSKPNNHFNYESTILTLSIGGTDVEISNFISIDSGEDPRTNVMIGAKNGTDFITNVTGLSQPRVVTLSFKILGLDELAVLDNGIEKRQLIDISIVDTSSGKTIQGVSGVPMKQITIPTISEEEPVVTLMIQFMPKNYIRN